MEKRMTESELYHYGIRGQKWGVRRYQNSDGSLTPAGKKRYENADGSLNDAGRKFYAARDAERRAGRTSSTSARDTALAEKLAREDNVARKVMSEYDKNHPSKLKSAKDAVDSASEGVNRLSNLEKQTRGKQKIMKMDLSNMSDQQMRSEINRAMLEKQYNDMFAPRKSDRGRKIAAGIIEGVGVTLSIGASALGIALAIKELKGS